MSKSIINPPTLELSHKGNNHSTAMNNQHSEGDATASTVSTASTEIQTAKRQLAPEVSDEGQQLAWPSSAGTWVKRPRLDLTDPEASSDPEVLSPTSIMSSRKHISSLNPPSRVEEARDTNAWPSVSRNYEPDPSTWPSLRRNYEPDLIMESSYIPRLWQLPPLYELSPLPSQTGGDSGHHNSRTLSTNMSSDGNLGDKLPRRHKPIHQRIQQGLPPYSQIAHDAVVTGNDFVVPPRPLAVSQDDTQPQVQSGWSANSETQRRQPRQSTPQGAFDTSSARNPKHSDPNTKFVKQSAPLTVSIDEQTRQFLSGTVKTSHLLTLSNPALAEDLESFPRRERHLISAYSRTEKGKKDVDFVLWYTEIRRPFWAHIISSFGKDVPSSLYNQVLAELCITHPCVKDPLTGHGLYKALLGTKDGTRCLMRLKDWMYGTGTTTLATWRDTLSTKIGSYYTKVPWVQREKIVALSVILACADAQATPGARTKTTMQSKLEILEKCKLTYMLSNQDHVVENEYWDGLAEELEEDPAQEQLYGKVMRAKQPITSGSSMTWPSFPIRDQEA